MLDLEPVNDQRKCWQTGQRVEVTRGELCGRTGAVVLHAGTEVLVRFEPEFNWPMINTIGIPARYLRPLSGRS
ncbi:MAG: hypothetical protein RLZ51_153 [Pseudomonadota bacterium]